MSKITDEFQKIREKREKQDKNYDKNYKKIFELIEKAQFSEEKGNFFDAADLFEKAAQKAGEIGGDKELQNKLLNKIEECMVKGEEKRDKLDKIFSV